MKKTFLWILAFLITISLAVYQKKTGPTYHVSGHVKIDGVKIDYTFNRSHGGAGDQEVSIFLEGNKPIEAYLLYKRYRVNENWTEIKMQKIGKNYTAFLPHQPPAGKLEYYVKVNIDGKYYSIPAKSVVTRFKGAVPLYILIPHIIFMFASLLLCVRIALALIFKEPYKNLLYTCVGLFFIGGLVLGPIVQKYAFGELWTGIPFGWDLTDNKTLIAFLFWLPALYFIKKEYSKRSVITTVFAIVVMLTAYLIPHSVWGSEFDYSKNQITTGKKPAVIEPASGEEK